VVAVSFLPSKDGIGRDRKRRKLSSGPRPAREGKTRPLVADLFDRLDLLQQQQFDPVELPNNLPFEVS